MSKTKVDATQPSKDSDAPAATTETRPIRPNPEGEKYDQLAKRAEVAESRQEALLDEANEESFPASDPISPKHMTSPSLSESRRPPGRRSIHVQRPPA